MQVYALSQKGMLHTENEDRIIVGRTILSCGVYHCDDHSGVVAVADGVGGNSGGAIASHFIANRLGDMKNLSTELLKSINEELIEFSNNNIGCSNMATTLSGIISCDNRISIFHIGNSRIFSLLNGKYLKQLTEDDTTLNYFIKAGKILPDDVDAYKDNNEITACFGAGNPELWRIKTADISDVKTLLLTTDGVHNFVSIDELEEVIAGKHDFMAVCNFITSKALENGSDDDISVVIAHFSDKI